MPRLALLALALLPLARPAADGLSRQERADFHERLSNAVTHLESGVQKQIDRAITVLGELLLLKPEDPQCAYNLACGHALSGDVEQGLGWLERAAEWGIGNFDGQLAVIEADAQLEPLRADERYAAALATMRRKRAEIEAYMAAPASYVPKRVQRREDWPLLVVMHGADSCKTEVVEGLWRQVADGARVALLAPSGRYPLGGEPADGIRWIRDEEEYLRAHATIDGPVVEAARRYLAEHPVDPERVVIAGVGEAAPIAFHIALRNPDLFTGVVLVEQPFNPDLGAAAAPAAGKEGLRARLLLDEELLRWMIELDGADIGPSGYCTALDQQLAAWGIEGQAELAELGSERRLAKDLRKAVERVLD